MLVHVPCTVLSSDMYLRAPIFARDDAEPISVIAQCRFEWWVMHGSATDPEDLGPDDTKHNKNFTMDPLTCLECSRW